jgi:hypothetical protein
MKRRILTVLRVLGLCVGTASAQFGFGGPILRGAKGGPLVLNMLANESSDQHSATERTTTTASRKIGSRLSGMAAIRSIEASQRG